jgi:hypothetical protein
MFSFSSEVSDATFLNFVVLQLQFATAWLISCCFDIPFCIGAGCFSSTSRKVVAERAEVAIICCCMSTASANGRNTWVEMWLDLLRIRKRISAGSPHMMAPGAGDLPEGIMNIHDATSVSCCVRNGLTLHVARCVNHRLVQA